MEAATSAAHHGNRISQALAHWGLALLHALRGEVSSGLREAERSLAVMQEIGSAPGVLLAGCVREHLVTTDSTSPMQVAPAPRPQSLSQTWQERYAFCELAGTWLAEKGMADEQHRAREYLTRAVDLAGTLGMHAAREHALALLSQLDAHSSAKPKKRP